MIGWQTKQAALQGQRQGLPPLRLIRRGLSQVQYGFVSGGHSDLITCSPPPIVGNQTFGTRLLLWSPPALYLNATTLYLGRILGRCLERQCRQWEKQVLGSRHILVQIWAL